MSTKQEVLVNWDKDKKWEEIKSVKNEVIDKSVTTVAKPGVRYWFTEKGGSKQSFISEVGALFISFFFAGIVPLLIILFFIGWLSRRARIIFLCSFLTLLIPVKVYDITVLKWRLWDCLYDYFSYSMIFDGGFDPNRKYLYAQYPHGVAPMATAVSGMGLTYFSPTIPCYISLRLLCLTSALIIPVYSAIIRWLGSIEASNKKLREALSEGSCNVVVDGIAGMYVNEPDKEMVKFSGRKGFIRAAVETGTPIVPAFNFGNSRLLALIPKFLEKPARKLQCAMGIIVGRWGLPFPKKIMLLTVAGKPIEVKKMTRDDPHYSERAAESVL
ncbi:hypothetical protein BLSTO_03992 [Blastocystis sp. subtype 1]